MEVLGVHWRELKSGYCEGATDGTRTNEMQMIQVFFLAYASMVYINNKNMF